MHRVILASVSSLFRGRLLGGRGPQPLSLDVTPGGLGGRVDLAYEGVLGSRPHGRMCWSPGAPGSPPGKGCGPVMPGTGSGWKMKSSPARQRN